MAIAKTGVYEEAIAGTMRPLHLRNGEIERFEVQHNPFGIFELWDQLCGRGSPQIRHIRDILTLALVGGGMSDRAADEVMAGLPPSENLNLRALAFRVLGVTFMPKILEPAVKKKAGSRRIRPSASSDTTPPPESETSAA